jgi:hypothetical protein
MAAAVASRRLHPVARSAALAALPLAIACGTEDGPAPADASLAVASVQPAPQAPGAALDTGVTVRFDRPLDRASVTPRTFHAFGRSSGPAAGRYEFAEGDRAVTLRPERAFSAGELVTVFLARGVRAQDGGTLAAGGHSFQFWTRSAPSALDFEPIQVMSTRASASERTRAYGGLATDLDGDGALDLTIVNEDSADLRVFRGRGDGRFEDFLRPPARVGPRASPSEAADFDLDGRADAVVANIDADTVSVLLGRGDATFAPARTLAVGRFPRGIAVLDADGDGDVDVAVAQARSSNLALLRNDGAGQMAPPVPFEGGVDGEWGLAAADFTGDGRLDLVVGGQDRRAVVLRSEGDGRFTPLSPVDAGGEVWMLTTGDVNGDGFVDVATANSNSNNGAILLGDGRGGLRRAGTYSVGPFTIASDLADLDGDGDLDWVLSSYGGSWAVLAGDGSGGFRQAAVVPASAAASCALLLDFDGDRDLDLALVDEDADEVRLLRNRGPR